MSRRFIKIGSADVQNHELEPKFKRGDFDFKGLLGGQREERLH